jgi:pimeloyl-ACP methyl ester carboxylesterase
VVGEIDGPVLLAGHSYGGSVITAAGTADNVVGLVYISGFVQPALLALPHAVVGRCALAGHRGPRSRPDFDPGRVNVEVFAPDLGVVRALALPQVPPRASGAFLRPDSRTDLE